jgi:hypothetical protein
VNIRDRLAMDVTGHYGMFITLVGIELANDARNLPGSWRGRVSSY